jgi:hypothetical protein
MPQSRDKAATSDGTAMAATEAAATANKARNPEAALILH